VVMIWWANNLEHIRWQALYGYFPLLLRYICFMFLVKINGSRPSLSHACNTYLNHKANPHPQACLFGRLSYVYHLCTNTNSPTTINTHQHITPFLPDYDHHRHVAKWNTCSSHSPTTTAHLVSSSEWCLAKAINMAHRLPTYYHHWDMV
jgi:hypothetical protein